MFKKLFKTILFILITCIILQHLFPSKAQIFIRIGSLAIAIPIMIAIFVIFIASRPDGSIETKYEPIELEPLPEDTRSDFQKHIDKQNEIRLIEKTLEGKAIIPT